MRELNERDYKVQTPSYTVHRSRGCYRRHGGDSQHCCLVYLAVVKRVNPKSSDHKGGKVFKGTLVVHRK